MALQSRRVSALFIISIFVLQMVLISDNIKPVKAFNKKLAIKLKTIASLLLLLKMKKPKFGILPVPLPLPIPVKVEKPHHKVVVHKAHPEHIAIAEPMHEPWPESHW